MAYEEPKKLEMNHHIIIEERNRMSISGVEDVESFDETSIVMYTSRGSLEITGRDLRMEKLSLDGGELTVNGQVDSLRYDDEAGKGGGGFWSRLFR